MQDTRSNCPPVCQPKMLTATQHICSSLPPAWIDSISDGPVASPTLPAETEPDILGASPQLTTKLFTPHHRCNRELERSRTDSATTPNHGNFLTPSPPMLDQGLATGTQPNMTGWTIKSAPQHSSLTVMTISGSPSSPKGPTRPMRQAPPRTSAPTLSDLRPPQDGPPDSTPRLPPKPQDSLPDTHCGFMTTHRTHNSPTSS